MGLDDRVQPLGQHAILSGHGRDLREQVAFSIPLLVRAEPRRFSAFSSATCSFIAARSSAVNPVDASPVASVPLADLLVPFFAAIFRSFS